MRNLATGRPRHNSPSLPDVSAFLGISSPTTEATGPSSEACRLSDLGYAPELASSLAMSAIGRDILNRRDAKRGGGR